MALLVGCRVGLRRVGGLIASLGTGQYQWFGYHKVNMIKMSDSNLEFGQATLIRGLHSKLFLPFSLLVAWKAYWEKIIVLLEHHDITCVRFIVPTTPTKWQQIELLGTAFHRSSPKFPVAYDPLTERSSRYEDLFTHTHTTTHLSKG